MRRLALLLPAVLAACGETSTTPSIEPPVSALQIVSGGEQIVLAGRRSPEPFRVRALGIDGRPTAGRVVRFSLRGEGGGILGQPRALTNADGIAETYVLEARSGPVVLTAEAGSGGALVVFEFEIERAPAELRFEEASGASGLPGMVHPDSVVRVRVIDFEGRPMAEQEIWFTGPPELSRVRDSTDADGWASTVIRKSETRAGEGRVFAFMLPFPELTTFTTRPLVAPARRVVLVSVDGLRGDAIARYAPPTLSALAATGAFTATARTVSPSLTTPAHLSLLSGVSPEGHGIFSEDLEFTAAMAGLDPLFKSASSNAVEARAFMTSGGPLADFEVVLKCKLAFGLESLTLVDPGAGRISAAAEGALTDSEVGLIFLHIPDPDLAGHAFGFESDEYRDAVLATDAALGQLLTYLGEDDLLVVTSDHGGGGAFGAFQHGSTSPEDMRIPLLLHGSHVAPGDLGDPSILDVAPTVLWALGFRPPTQYEGDILLRGFDDGL